MTTNTSTPFEGRGPHLHITRWKGNPMTTNTSTPRERDPDDHLHATGGESQPDDYYHNGDGGARWMTATTSTPQGREENR